ncbi:hypothetical protein BDY24DRAFT_372797 [Mrakia frigida]|uniref:uncharacterized protein n=1 Tax=Mrakia frigida TaxID=29902 RepID=UPI003FCBEE63
MSSTEPGSIHAPLLLAKARLEELLPLLHTFSLPSSPVIDQNGPANSEISSSDLPGLKKYESAVRKEIEWIDKMVAAPPPSNPQKAAPASNAPHLLALFESAYRAPYPVIGLNSTFPRLEGKPTTSREKGKANQGPLVPDVKVHVVAEGGKVWIRVIAITNIRLLFEFYESDSYINSDSSFSDDSEASTSSIPFPGFNPSHLRTSLHKTAHQLLQAASLHSPPPKIQIQCPRLRPDEDEDGRVGRTVTELRSLGVEVLLDSSPSFDGPSFQNPPPKTSLCPTRNLNLDLSVLIALSSSIVHDPLPSTGLAEGVYKPLIRRYNKDGTLRAEAEASIAKMGGTDNWRALTIQLESEIEAPLVDEITKTLQEKVDGEVVFWTTTEAKERLKMIVNKLGGEREKSRAEGMFWVEELGEKENEERATRFWKTSRYNDRVGPVHLALSSIRLSSPSGSASPSSPPTPSDPPPPSTTTSSSTYQTLNSALANLQVSPTGTLPTPDVLLVEPFSHLHPSLMYFLNPTTFSSSSSSSSSSPSTATKPPASLTPHTLRTLLFGLERGMTTLSANRASLKSVWKAIEGKDPSLGIWGGEGEETRREAVAWVVEPRSLGESMVMD